MSAKSESGAMPLHLAAEGGHTAIIQVRLISNISSSILVCTRLPFCPDTVCSCSSPTELRRQALLQAGADVNADCMPGCSWTPIFFACAVSPATRIQVGRPFVFTCQGSGDARVLLAVWALRGRQVAGGKWGAAPDTGRRGTLPSRSG